MPVKRKVRAPSKRETTDALRAYEYAYYILKAPFPAGEAVIATNAGYSVLYARDVLNGRFLLGEPTIARWAEESLKYAREVIKGRWPPGEATIISTASFFGYSGKYLEFLKERDPEGYAEFQLERGDWAPPVTEAQVPVRPPTRAERTDPWSAYRYASNRLHGRWPEGEAVIATDAKAAANYAYFCLHRRFPAGESIMRGTIYWEGYIDMVRTADPAGFLDLAMTDGDWVPSKIAEHALGVARGAI